MKRKGGPNTDPYATPACCLNVDINLLDIKY